MLKVQFVTYNYPLLLVLAEKEVLIIVSLIMIWNIYNEYCDDSENLEIPLYRIEVYIVLPFKREFDKIVVFTLNVLVNREI